MRNGDGRSRAERELCGLVLLRRVTAAALLPWLIALGGCRSSGLPKPGTGDFLAEVTAFYVGLAALQVGDDVRADSTLERATQLAQGEPAGWANWGVLALRQGNFEAAAQRLGKAQTLAPQNDQMHYLLGILESKRGNPTQAIAELRKAVAINPRNLRAMYLLAQEVERQGDANGEAEFQQWLEKILAVQPGNPAALLELGRVAAKRGDAQTLHSVLQTISTVASGWPPEVQPQWRALQQAASGPDARAAAVRIAFLRNSLMRVPDFRQSLSLIQPIAGNEAVPFDSFLRLPAPSPSPAAADRSLHFQNAAIPGLAPAADAYSWLGAISLNGTGAPTVVVANRHTVQVAAGATFPFPGGAEPLEPEAILPVDFDYDFKTDLVLAGEGGLRFMHQDNPGSFTDVTAQTKLPAAILHGAYTGAWAIDVEADGDMDVLLGAHEGEPLLLRNNGDGSFTPMHPFTGVAGMRGFAWGDLDGDGNPDAAFIDGAGRVHCFHNQRGGNYREVRPASELPLIKAITVADAGSQGRLALVALEESGGLAGVSLAPGGEGWLVSSLGAVASDPSGEVRLRAADYDNNGAIDLLVTPVSAAAGDQPRAVMLLADGARKWSALSQPVGPARVFAAADINGDGRLDLLGLSAAGLPQQALNQGEKKYQWQILRPRAHQATGDQRINSFGVGGEIEMRAGLLAQRQPIDGPQVHFGLGEQNTTDVARVLWPNGTESAEFALKADQEILTEQRLKGSCPFLFAWNGHQIAFVKDAVPWGSAIGLQIDSVGSPGIAATQEWYKIGGGQLAPRDGYYDLRLTGELWETYYYDYLKLMVVDHPAGTAIYTDERFVVPAAKPAITAVAPPHAVLKATDDRGVDVTEVVSKLDGRYLDTFGRGQYQGLTRDHYVEVDLGESVPAGGPLWLIAQGWLHPTDSTVNVAISQGRHEKAHALSLEVPDGHGGWRVARSNLGFPAGRNKTCLIDLEHVFLPGTPHKLRLRTNLEVYWDAIEWAQGRPDAPLKVTSLDPSRADLHYRGYSAVHQANPSSPELPDYQHLAATTQIWRDLEGYYTRYGDIRGLLARIDDRYVIMNAGDEMALRFPEQPPPSPGWVRDYVIAGDGWIKDGDYNSTFSRTVQPLPYHAKRAYNDPPGKLEEEWVYQQHPEDWQTYHTRYVTSQVFDEALGSGALKGAAQ